MDCTPILQITIKRKFQISKTVRPMLCLSFLIKCVVRKSLIYHHPFWLWRWGSESSAYSRLQSWVLETKLAHGNGCLTLCFHYAPWTEIESSWWNQITVSVGKCHFLQLMWETKGLLSVSSAFRDLAERRKRRSLNTRLCM